MQPTQFGTSNPVFTPTAMGVNAGAVATVGAAAPLANTTTISLPDNFPVNLPQEKMAVVLERVEKFDFATLPTQQIVLLGQEPTNYLNQALSSLLDRVTKQDNPQVFKLVDTLSDEIAKERIGELAEQILSAKPSLMHRILGMFSKKALQKGLDQAYEELGRTARNKSKSLSDVIQGMERNLQTEMKKLTEELRSMEALKEQYRDAFTLFAEEVLFLHNALAKAQSQVPAMLAAADKDVVLQQDIQDKLQALESVALSREAMMTRLPGEQMIIRQLQNAGVSTLQELSITMGDRFASIRMTLVGIHGANMVRNVQRLGQANANLDNQLQEARAKLMQTVVTTAAQAPGNNRLEQANNLKRVVADTQNLQNIVDAARASNKEKFNEARTIMAKAREDMLVLGSVIQPGAPLNV